ncbi:SDR family NAD(P)-dependent oxidoreductase [Pseudonocardia dioxanivorans]|uniref:SDR family NAD(P)-dependent oxidoreductase n=1 Tax=Pseudonocardia dioxanivorans TaxID=240495 RepID=UPI00131A499F|nr:SDR family oxidoreductase [Pseudonocardia dioxanivorans]
MPSSDRFAGRVAIVTGAGRGIGAAVALGLSAEGATVVANDVTAGALAETVAKDPSIIASPGDIADPATSDALVAAALDAGGLHLIANVAGVFTSASADAITTEAYRRDMGVNVDGIVHLVRAAAPTLIGQRGGAILNVASTAGFQAVPNAFSYVVTKHAVIGITRSLSTDWARHSIRVNALCPGPTMTEMTAEFARMHPDRHARRIARIPLGRACDPTEQAAVALFLLSDDAGFVTGQAVTVDGGGEAMHSGYDLPAS